MHEPVAVDRHDPPRLLHAREQRAERLGTERHAARKPTDPRAREPALPNVLLEHVLWRTAVQERKMREERRSFAAHAWWIDVEQAPAADRHDRAIRAHDEAITGQRDDRRFQAETRERRLPSLELRAIEEQDSRHDLAGGHVEADAVARLQRSGRVGQELERAI